MYRSCRRRRRRRLVGGGDQRGHHVSHGGRQRLLDCLGVVDDLGGDPDLCRRNGLELRHDLCHGLQLRGRRRSRRRRGSLVRRGDERRHGVR